VLTLLFFRLMWGVWGSETARLLPLIQGPHTVLPALRATLTGHPPLSVGHNPVGGWSVLLLLTLLLAQCTAGLFASDDVIVSGPLKHLVSSTVSGQLTTLHSILYWGILGVVVTHVSAVLFHRKHGDDLIATMISGFKTAAQLPPHATAPQLRPLWVALLTLVVAIGGVWVVLHPELWQQWVVDPAPPQGGSDESGGGMDWE